MVTADFNSATTLAKLQPLGNLLLSYALSGLDGLWGSRPRAASLGSLPGAIFVRPVGAGECALMTRSGLPGANASSRNGHRARRGEVDFVFGWHSPAGRFFRSALVPRTRMRPSVKVRCSAIEWGGMGGRLKAEG